MSNVIDLKAAAQARQNGPSNQDITAEEWEALSDERKAILGSLAGIGQFLLDNKLKINYLVSIINVVADDGEGSNFFVLNTPITNSDFALGLKMLDNAFVNNLNSGNY